MKSFNVSLKTLSRHTLHGLANIILVNLESYNILQMEKLSHTEALSLKYKRYAFLGGNDLNQLTVVIEKDLENVIKIRFHLV